VKKKGKKYPYSCSTIIFLHNGVWVLFNLLTKTGEILKNASHEPFLSFCWSSQGINWWAAQKYVSYHFFPLLYFFSTKG
jgi:hypothetical protein